MPKLGPLAYVAEIAFDAGMHDLNWRELQAWCEVKQTALTPWESHAVMEMARAYMESKNEHRDKPTPAPYQPGVIDREKVAANVRAALRRRR